MDQGAYTYQNLGKKYDNFTAPGFEITLGGTALANSKLIVPRLEVEITSDGGAGGPKRSRGAYSENSSSRKAMVARGKT